VKLKERVEQLEGGGEALEEPIFIVFGGPGFTAPDSPEAEEWEALCEELGHEEAYRRSADPSFLSPEAREKAKANDTETLRRGIYILKCNWPEEDLMQMVPVSVRRRWLKWKEREGRRR
jgi:hypothetical protein